MRIAGPSFAATDEELASLFVIQDAVVESYQWGSEAWQDGIAVTVNDRLRFERKIEDYEDEVMPLAQVELIELGGIIDSAFIMIANGRDGVAHDIEISALIDGIPGEPTSPVTIEMRGSPTP